MATVYKRANSKFWYAKFYNSLGKRVAVSTGKEKRREAEKVAEDFESADRKRGAKSDIDPKIILILETAARESETGSLTLSRAAELLDRMKKVANPDFRAISLREKWTQWRKEQEIHIGPSTSQGYDDDADIFESALGEKVMSASIGDLKTEHIQNALLIAAKGRRGSTVNKALASLRRVLESAVAAGQIAANPAKQVRPLPQYDSIEKGPFTLQEVRSLIDAAKVDEWIGAITIAAQTGLRIGDIAKLGRDHVDGTRFIIRPSKTQKSRKTITIPMSPPVISWVGEKKGHFFPTIGKMTPSKRAEQFKAIMKRANVPRTIIVAGDVKISRSFHSLRHTFASWLAEADVHADVRQKLTGHSSSKIHQRYTHHDLALNRAVETLPEL